MKFMQSMVDMESVVLSLYNGEVTDGEETERQSVEAAEYQRIDEVWHFEAYP
jgi:demethoxyubiquinone hydroxylase (CLK1/Coq7/Cat5 family)